MAGKFAALTHVEHKNRCRQINVVLEKVSRIPISADRSSPLRARLAFRQCFQFADRCGPSELGGSVFDPSSYSCSATCELTNGAPSTPIGVFHEEIVNDLLPTLHGKNRKHRRHRADASPFAARTGVPRSTRSSSFGVSQRLRDKCSM